jgi:hypothetical protein
MAFARRKVKIKRRSDGSSNSAGFRTDTARMNETSRAELVDALLKGAENDQLFIEIEHQPDLHKLSHHCRPTQPFFP